MSRAIQLHAALKTDQGMVRPYNDDSVGSWEPSTPEEVTRDGWIYLVADGVGGLAGGSIASKLAVEKFILHYRNNTTTDWGTRIQQAVQSAHEDIIAAAALTESSKHMATTLVGAIIRDKMAILLNVGDSRGYLLRNGTLNQITRDQSLVAQLVEQGALTAEEALTHPHKNVILSSLGSTSNPSIDVFELPLQSGDRLLLCSDGLSNFVTDSELTEILTLPDPADAVVSCIDRANAAGGRDNIGAAVIDITFPAAAQNGAQIIMPQPKAPLQLDKRFRRILRWYTFFLALLESGLITWIWWLIY